MPFGSDRFRRTRVERRAAGGFGRSFVVRRRRLRASRAATVVPDAFFFSSPVPRALGVSDSRVPVSNVTVVVDVDVGTLSLLLRRRWCTSSSLATDAGGAAVDVMTADGRETSTGKLRSRPIAGAVHITITIIIKTAITATAATTDK